jgi:hypothetical protein
MIKLNDFIYSKSNEQILKEVKALCEALSSDMQKKVGDVFLGGDRKIAKLQGTKPEEDTEWEKDLHSKLVTWISASETHIAKYFAKNKELLQILAKEFPSVLQPPIGKTAYRGTIIKIDSLKNAFLKKPYNVVNIGGVEAFHFKNLDYNPKRDSQSWTVKPAVAFQFDKLADNEKTVHVVYATKVNKDFVFNPELLNIILGFKEGENEVVRVGRKGSFEAFVSTEVLYNTWRLDPSENFVHKVSKAKPFFDLVISKYNTLATKENKKAGNELIPLVKSIQDIINIEYGASGPNSPEAFNFKREYSDAVKRFIKYTKKQ